MRRNVIIFFAAILFILGVSRFGAAQTPIKFDSETISGLGARNIGSATMSGRIAAVDAVQEGQRLTIFVGSASGGVWKSLNGGSTYKPVFDKQPVQSIGAVTIDPKNPKVVWVGTGEAWTRNSTSIGDGVYKSTDGGENWIKINDDGRSRNISTQSASLLVLRGKALKGDPKALAHFMDLAARFSTGEQQALVRELAPNDQAILAAYLVDKDEARNEE